MSNKSEVKAQLEALDYRSLVNLEKKMVVDGIILKKKGVKMTKVAVIARLMSMSVPNDKTVSQSQLQSQLQSMTLIAAAPAPIRLPKVWEFEADRRFFPSDQALQLLKRKRNIQPGDVIMPGDGEFYRGDGTLIVGRDKKPDYGVECMNGEILLPPWVFEVGMKNGFSFEELRPIYQNTAFSLMIYPKSLQGKHLKVKDGVITSLRSYEPYSEKDVILKKGDEHFDDLDGELLEATLFL